MPGPIPKDSASRRRRRSASELPTADVAPAGGTGSAPAPDEQWHPRAREWFASLGESGQSRWYEASDWAMAKVAADMMSKLCEAEKPSAQMLASLLQLTTALMCTEGDRRRLRLELARGPQIDEDEVAANATVTNLRSRLGG